MYIPYSEPNRTNLVHVKPVNMWNWVYNSTVDSEKLTTLLPLTSVTSQSKSTLESESILGKNPAFHTIQITSGKKRNKNCRASRNISLQSHGVNDSLGFQECRKKSWGLVNVMKNDICMCENYNFQWNRRISLDGFLIEEIWTNLINI